MAIHQGKKVKYETGTTADFLGLLEEDGLQIAKGSNGLKVQRRPNNTGPWLNWTNEDCVVTVTASLPGTPLKKIEIVLTAPGGVLYHRGEVKDGITGATWTAEEGP